MSDDTNDRDRRAVRLGGVLILALLILFKGVPAWLTWRSASYAVAQTALEQAATTRGTLTSFPADLDSLQSRTARLTGLSARLFVGADSTAAANALANLLGDLARASGAKIDSTRASFPRGTGGLIHPVRLDAKVVADVAGLAGLIRRLETTPFYLAIRTVHVDASVDRPRTQPESLTVRLGLEGLSWVTPRGQAKQ